MYIWENYWIVIIFGIVAVLFPVGSMIANKLLRPTVNEPLKLTTYECGEVPVGDARIDFPFTHYIYAIIFVAADVMSVFLFLWALTFRVINLSDQAVALLSIFLLVSFVVIGIYYSLRGKVDIWV
jgi:NADH-quinone oxidoreductase subunit A